jgi:hypothetical protein
MSFWAEGPLYGWKIVFEMALYFWEKKFFLFLSDFGVVLGSGHCSYLVDPASSHMLVSKIKPCMSKYKQLYTVKLRMAH